MISIAVRKPYQNALSIVGEGLRAIGLTSQVNLQLVRSLQIFDCW